MNPRRGDKPFPVYMFNDKKGWRGAYVALVQCLMQQMRNRAIILAVLLTATPTLAAEHYAWKSKWI